MKQYINELIDYLHSLNTSNRTTSCLYSYLNQFARWIKDNYGIDSPEKILKSHLNDYQKYLPKKLNKKSLPISPGAVNNHIWAVNKFLKYLYIKGNILNDLSTELQLVQEPSLLPTSVLNHTEAKCIFEQVDISTLEGYRDRTILELLYTTGIRVGELVGLKLHDVNFNDGTMKVFGKGRKERIVPIGKTALRYLESYLKAIRPFLPGANDSRALFLNRRGLPLTHKTVQAIVPFYAEKAGIKFRVTPHTFRRSCTTELIRSNANLYHVKEILGHQSLDSLKPYTKLNIVDLKKTHALCHPRERD